MSRARNIKPGFFKNEQLAELPFEARLLFIGLWTLVDREGRMEDRPKRIHMEIFPADVVNVDALLDGLQEQGLIVRYAVDGAKYLAIPTWLKHQRPHHQEKPSDIPSHEPSERIEINPDKVRTASHEGANQSALNAESGMLNPESGILNAESGTHTRGKSTFAPADWTPNPVMQRLATPAAGVDIAFELEQFRLHEFAQPKSDWDRLWVAWLKRARPRMRDSPDARKQTTSHAESKHPALVAERQRRNGVTKIGEML